METPIVSPSTARPDVDDAGGGRAPDARLVLRHRRCPSATRSAAAIKPASTIRTASQPKPWNASQPPMAAPTAVAAEAKAWNWAKIGLPNAARPANPQHSSPNPAVPPRGRTDPARRPSQSGVRAPASRASVGPIVTSADSNVRRIAHTLSRWPRPTTSRQDTRPSSRSASAPNWNALTPFAQPPPHWRRPIRPH